MRRWHTIHDHGMQVGDSFTLPNGDCGRVSAVHGPNTFEVESIAPPPPKVRRSPLRWRDVLGACSLLIIAGGMCCLAGACCVIGLPYLLGRWLWCKARGLPW